MKKILRYGKHLLRAKGRHGTHSPFVYAFVEQVLRSKQRFNINDESLLSRKEINLLARTIGFLKPDHILADASLQDVLKKVTSLIKPALTTPAILNKENLALVREGKVLLVTLADGNDNDRLAEEALKYYNVFILLIKPYANEAAEHNWYSLAAVKEVKMRLDLWYIGLLVNDPVFKGSQYFRLR